MGPLLLQIDVGSGKVTALQEKTILMWIHCKYIWETMSTFHILLCSIGRFGTILFGHIFHDHIIFIETSMSSPQYQSRNR